MSEKGSNKYWENCATGYGKLDMGLNIAHKATYDRLVSLEAKIETLKNTIDLVYDISNNHFLVIELKEARSEYTELLKEHNL